MTLPLKKRSLLPQDFQHGLEANAVFLLANKLTTPPAPTIPLLVPTCGPVSTADAPLSPSSSPPSPDSAGVMVITPHPTPPPTPPTPPTPDQTAIVQPATKPVAANRTSSLPTANDPMDPSFLSTLHAPGEEGLINPTHIAIRRDVLQVRRTASGKVYFQCGCCARFPRNERAKYSTIAPQSLKNLYHAFVRFMMYHAKQCQHIPQEIRALDSPSAAKDVKAVGIKKYWRESAYERGLRDASDGRGIIFAPETV